LTFWITYAVILHVLHFKIFSKCAAQILY
jgi:hypothetical protein